MERVTLSIKGMHCDNCVNSVTDALKAVDGVKLAKVSLDEANAQITYDPAHTTVEKLKEAVQKAGYEA